MSVVDFPLARPLTNIPGQLRAMADRLENGQAARIAVVVLIGDDGEPRVYGYGELANSVEALGWLVRAMRGEIM